jgi:hypothetical protein
MVPDGKNPQQFNRYAYALNNPIKDTDPTGHFNLNEIEEYLRRQYGDKWEKYLHAWQSDNVFWNMLSLAQYGDTLFAPTVYSLGSGQFTYAGNTFGFTDSYQKDTLCKYQGYGPFQLTNGATTRLSVKDQIPVHFAESQDPGTS